MPGFNVLVVCRANHCRSPMAEFLLREQVTARRLPWNVTSAGVQAEEGRPMHPSAERLLAKRGLPVAGWTSSRVSGALVARADLILTSSEAHRSAVAQHHPAALGRTFTLLQFAHLAAGVSRSESVSLVDFGPWLLDRVQDNRGVTQPLPRAERDIADPMGMSYHRFKVCSAVIERAVAVIVASVPASASVVGRRSTAGA